MPQAAVSQPKRRWLTAEQDGSEAPKKKKK